MKKREKSHSWIFWVCSIKILLCPSVSFCFIVNFCCFQYQLHIFRIVLSSLGWPSVCLWFEGGWLRLAPLLSAPGSPIVWVILYGRLQEGCVVCPMEERCLQTGMFILCTAWVKDTHREDKQCVIHDIARNSMGKLAWRGGVHSNHAGY